MKILSPLRPTRVGPSAPRARAGIGAPFIVVMAVLVLLSLFAISMSLRSQGAARQSAKAGVAERCAALAEMAIREARHAFRRRIREPGDPFFEAVRPGPVPGEVLIPLSELPHTEGDLGRFQGFSTEGVRVRVLRRATLALEEEERRAYDAAGVVRFTCEVRGLRQVRSVQVIEHAYRSVLTAPPRPLDMFTFFLGDTRVILTENAHEDDGNKTIAWAVARLATLRKFMRDFADGLRRAAQKARDEASGLLATASGAASDLNRLADELDRMAGIYDQAAEPPEWPVADDWAIEADSTGNPGQVHAFQPGMVAYSFADRVELPRLDLPGRVGALVPDLEADDADIQRRIAEIERLLQQNDRSAANQLKTEAEELAPRITDAAGRWHQVLTAYKEFQDDLVEISGPEAQEIVKRWRSFRVPELRRRAQYVFRGDAAVERAQAFLGLRDRPPPSGMLFVEDRDPEAKLELALDGYRGRLVVASAGPIAVDRISVTDPTRDVVTVIGRGDVSVFQDGVQAALVVAHPSFRGSGGSIRGSLLLQEIPRGESGRILRGTIERQEAILSGPEGVGDARAAPDPEAIQVLLSPAPVYRREDR